VPPDADDSWVGLCADVLPVDEVRRWTATADCGALVVFTGLVRDHSEGRPDVRSLSYEAYEEHATGAIAAVVADARRRWPAIRRVAALHRVGTLAVGDDAVVVAVASPHRAEAFAAASFCIDAVKATVPIWKYEAWADGEAWGTCSHALAAEPEPHHAEAGSR